MLEMGKFGTTGQKKKILYFLKEQIFFEEIIIEILLFLISKHRTGG